jgi:hypothetical protein
MGLALRKPSARAQRTEIDVRRVRSTNHGFCYLKAGWVKGELKRGKLFLYAPDACSSQKVVTA